MIAIGNNDYISYNKLFDRYCRRLCQYVYSLLMDRNDAEDVVQELFLNLWKNRENRDKGKCIRIFISDG